jgi:PAS domain S-box-containing protein
VVSRREIDTAAMPLSTPLSPAGELSASGLATPAVDGMAAAIAERDWAATSLGPMADWPPTLRGALDLMLGLGLPAWILWGEDRALLYNDRGAAMLGGRHPAVLGQPVATAWPELWSTISADVDLAGKGLASDHVARPIPDIAGMPGFINDQISPIRIDGGRIGGVLVLLRDVTRDVEAAEQRVADVERTRAALSAARTVGSWDWDIVADRMTADASFAAFMGIDPERAASGGSAADFLAMVHRDDVAGVSAKIAAALSTGEDYVAEYRAVTMTGERWIMARGRCVYDAEGKPLRFPGVSFDITDRKRDEAARVLGEKALRDAKDERDFMLALVERQRRLSDPDDVMQWTVEALGARLGVDRAGFFEVIGDKIMRYGACWTAGALPPLIGDVPTAVFGDRLGAAIRNGQTLAFAGPDDPQAPDAVALDATGSHAEVTVPLIRDGRWEGGFYLSNAGPRAWTSGEIALVEEVAQLTWDAVARVRATAALRALNANLLHEVANRTAERDRIWEVSNDLLAIGDPDGTWWSVNPAWTETLGWDAGEIIGKTSEWLLHPDDIALRNERVAILNNGGQLRGAEIRLRAKDGAYHALSWTATIAEGRLYAIARDMTEERRQQAALRVADERTQLVLGAMSGVGVWSYDVIADRFYSDAGFATLYGFDTARLVEGATMAEVRGRIHPDDLAMFDAEIGRSRASGEDGEIEYRVVRPDGSMRRMMVRNHVLVDAAGHPETVVGVGIDVTEQRDLEERLRQAQKMEAVGQLTGGLAHDFNNLLTGISGALEMMQLRLKQGRIDDLPRYIGAAQTASGRAAALTHRLLAFSRRQPLDPRPIDPVSLIAGMEDLIRGTAGPAIDLRIIHPAKAWPILVDGNQLENALLNLCINARDAMEGPDSKGGGTLTIETANIWLGEGDAVENELPPGPYLTLRVSDTGTGMAPEVAARAFDPFFTTKPMGQGTGLGLSMIYGFARQSGGQIRIRSGVGEGTTMCLYLPRHDGDASGVAAIGGGPSLRREATGEVVLVVDDEPAIRMLVIEALEELGYDSLEAGDGAEAVALLNSDQRIDLLVTDVGLPGGMNGRQVADVARRARPDIPVLFITGFAENAVVGDGPLEAGMALVTKPFALDALAARIRAMIAAG